MDAPRSALIFAFAAGLAASACDGEDAMRVEPDAGQADDAGELVDAGGVRLPYAEILVRFTAGPGAGFGAADLPDVVLGAPRNGGPGGSLDVLSLGSGGEIILGFEDDRAIIDGPGPDFVVFENAFYTNGDPTQPFAELAEVAISEDGATWSAFSCDPAGAGMGRFPGCAGWTPTQSFDPSALIPIDPQLSGGDAFDLADLGLTRARFVRVRDLETNQDPNTAGFDLDAIGLVHYRDP